MSKYILVIDRVKMWRRANVWGGNWGTEIVLCRELGRDLSWGIAAYLCVQSFLCVRLLTGNTKVRVYSIRSL